MKKMGIFVSLLLIGAFAYAGPAPEGSSVLEVNEPVKLVATFWGGAAKIGAFEKSVAAYQEKYPNVTIELLNIPGGDYNGKILSMIAANTPPDVININSTLSVELEGQLVDLTGKMTELGYFDTKNGLWPEWFNLLATDGFYNKGEALFTAPLGTGSDVLAYNKQMFVEAGVEFPNENWTWEEDFLEAAKKLTRDGQFGVTGVPFRNSAVLYPMAKANGGAVYDYDALKFTGNSQPVIDAYQFAQDLIYKHKVHPTPAEEEALGGANGGVFRNQKAAMYFMPTWQFPPYYGADFEWDIMQLPSGREGSWSSIYGGRLSVLKSSPNIAHGIEFIDLINGPIGQGYFSVESGFNNPPLKSIAYGDAFMKGPKGAPEHNEYRVTVLEKAVIVYPVLPNGSKIGSAWGNKLDLFWQNEIDAAQMMRELEREVQPLLDDR